LPEAKLQTARTRKAKELEHLQERYPQEFAERYTAELTTQKTRYGKVISAKAAEAEVLLKLREKYGIVK
jgi:uncharacterized protein YeaO (DUF488 family)